MVWSESIRKSATSRLFIPLSLSFIAWILFKSCGFLICFSAFSSSSFCSFVNLIFAIWVTKIIFIYNIQKRLSIKDCEYLLEYLLLPNCFFSINLLFYVNLFQDMTSIRTLSEAEGCMINQIANCSLKIRH